jgi:hypothetical protein
MPFRLRQPYFIEGWCVINQHSILLDKALSAGNKQLGTNLVQFCRRLAVIENSLKFVVEDNMVLRTDIACVQVAHQCYQRRVFPRETKKLTHSGVPVPLLQLLSSLQ